VRSRQGAVALVWLLCGTMAVGCGRTSDRARLEEAFREAGLPKSPVAPVAGVVTVDGSVPAPFTLVMLWDPKSPSGGVFRTTCDAEGKFAFTSYESGDGVPPGSYVVLFGQFNMGGKVGHFEAPDLLHNLYNDPDKNALKPEFQITVDATGKADYQFNLALDGIPPVAAPGPHAVTDLKMAT
jgi:hypothetical protein